MSPSATNRPTFGVMFGRSVALLGLIGAMSAVQPARTETSFEIAYASGSFIQASQMATAEQTPASMARAARALLSQYVVETEPRDLQLVHRAEQLARAALQYAPDDAEAKIQLATALSLKLRLMSTSDARRSPDGKYAKRLAEDVLDADPDNPWAHGFLSIWHVEVRRKGGPIGARLFGASLKEADRHFRSAIAARPDDPSFRWQYGRALLALNAKKYADDVAELFSENARLSASSAIEQTMQARSNAYRMRLAEPNPDYETIEALAAADL